MDRKVPPLSQAGTTRVSPTLALARAIAIKRHQPPPPNVMKPDRNSAFEDYSLGCETLRKSAMTFTSSRPPATFRKLNAHVMAGSA